jgi:hypothetical protein
MGHTSWWHAVAALAAAVAMAVVLQVRPEASADANPRLNVLYRCIR